LRTRAIDVIGLIVPDITNPFFSQLAKNVELEAAARSYGVMLANSLDNPLVEQGQVSTLLEYSPRGLIVVASADSDETKIDTDTPIIALDRRFDGRPLVATDHYESSGLVADHLHALGHRRICYIAGPQNTTVGRLRLEGFRSRIEALDRADDPVDLSVYNAQFDYASGEAAAREILSQPTDRRPTAIAAANDQIAIGTTRAARDLGLSVPNDVSVAGFDDITLATLVVPRLTTIAQPSEQLAKASLSALLDGGGDQDVLINGTLVARGSTAGPPRD
ncbi:MAG: substrate-binding domain-containing protein, partial [Devosiaceae bacterium]|nr:substrate-binding domain-containing protein [Devosiaceae bacterium MH13]